MYGQCVRECEEMLKIVQRHRDSRLDLAGGSRLARCQKLYTCQACQNLKCHASQSSIGQKAQIGRSVTSWLELAAQSSREAKPLANSVLKNRVFAFLSHPSIYMPYTHEMQRAFRENFERETLEKNKIDSFTIFTQRLFKFLCSLPLHCYILEIYITKIFSHHTYIYEKAVWCFGKQLRRDQFHIG